LVSSATVSAHVYNEADFRTPDDAGVVQDGLEVAYYELSNPQALPDFDAGNTNTVGIQTVKLENEGWERDFSVVEPSES